MLCKLPNDVLREQACRLLGAAGCAWTTAEHVRLCSVQTESCSDVELLDMSACLRPRCNICNGWCLATVIRICLSIGSTMLSLQLALQRI